MPIYLLILAIALFLISLPLNQYAYRISLKWGWVISHVGTLLLEQSILIIILYATEMFISEATDFSIYSYWRVRIPDTLHPYIITAYCIIVICLKLKYAIELRRYSNISSVKKDASHPVLHLQYFLINATAHLDISQRKLALLKDFSPIPLALLVFNNFSKIRFDNITIKTFVSSNQLNIFLLAVVGVYVYLIIIAFIQVKHYVLHIAHIQREIYTCEHPEHEKFLDYSL